MNNQPPTRAQAVQSAGCALTLAVFVLLPLALLLAFMGPIGWTILAGLAALLYWTIKG